MRSSPHALLPVASTVACLATAVAVLPAWAAPTTAYDVPFPCGQTWTGSTRAGHTPSAKSVDFNRNPDMGAPVVAAATGVVTSAQATPRGGYGRYLVVDHGNGESSLYAHLASVAVARGQRVDQGTMVGTVGDSGNVRGSHLHFEQHVGRTVVAPWFAGAPYAYGPITSRNCVDVPMAGDFAGDRAAELVVYRRARRPKFLIRQPGARPIRVRFGRASDDPLLGDWDGDGRLDVGARNPKRSVFKLRTGSGVRKVAFGLPSDQPITGDWDGNGVTNVGVRRSSDATFWPLLADGSTAPVWLGDSDDLPVTGDWDGNGVTDLGVFDQATATFTLRTLAADGSPRLHVQQFGAPGDLPVSGDWDGNGVTDLGVWSPATATFSQAVASTPLSGRFEVRTIRFGRRR